MKIIERVYTDDEDFQYEDQGNRSVKDKFYCYEDGMTEKRKVTPLMVRKRLQDDFEFYCKSALKIRTKSGAIVPFVLNQEQRALLNEIDRQWATTGKVRIVLLKARQMGMSTFIQAYIYFKLSQVTGQRALVLTHKAEATQTIFSMTQRFHDNVPEILKPHTKYSNRRELVFDKLESSYFCGTAGSDSVARGETIQYAHLSEAAFYPRSSARELVNGLLQAIPETAGSFCIIESTANGYNHFQELWKNAENGANGFTPVFLSWLSYPEYAVEVPVGFEPDPKERELAEKYGMTNEQLMFRRRRIAESGEDLFMQEYPLCPTDAFLVTGRPVFDARALEQYVQETTDPIAIKTLEGTEWIDSKYGELKCYAPFDTNGTYYIGADVAMGLSDGDYSAAVVLDAKANVVAVWRSHIEPDRYATILYALGKFYNNALIAVENNNHGLTTLTALKKYLYYPRVYAQQRVDKVTNERTEILGFSTDSKTKPLIIDELRAAVRKREIVIPDRTIVEEMITYIVDESGKTNAQRGSYDDTVMALAIALRIHPGEIKPIQNQDEWYYEPV